MKLNSGKLFNGECLEILKDFPSNSIDSMITDPPYGLGYYSLKWDKKVPEPEIWKECCRVLKPGAFIFVMSSPRQDILGRMIANLDEAGFYTGFTSLYWTYKTGFPKAQRIGTAIDEKLGFESKIVETKDQRMVKFEEMKYLEMKGNCCEPPRIEYSVKEPTSELGKKLKAGYKGFQPRPVVEVILVAMKPLSEKSYIDQAMSNEKGVTFLDNAKIPFKTKDGQIEKRFASNLIVSDKALDPFRDGEEVEIECYDKQGNSFSFSLDAWAGLTLPHLMGMKAQKNEKELGLENLRDDRILVRKPGQRSFNVPNKHRPSARKNIHPTVKPLKLMAYLTVLGTLPGNIILDPFCGTGTTCLAGKMLGRKFIGIEMEKTYFEIARERLKNVKGKITKTDTGSRVETPLRKLSEVESFEIKHLGGPVLDGKSSENLPELINKVLDNPTDKVFEVDGFRVTPAIKPEEKTNLQEWADKGINVFKGCSNDCRYCYARAESVRLHGNTPEQWKNEILNEKVYQKGWRLSKKSLIFPSTHDITPGTYDACEEVLKKVLAAGNKVLVISKPRPDLIEKLCDALAPYKKQVNFRFTITAQNENLLAFWEPNAPDYKDRKKALVLAHEKNFMTSISIEPMLDSANVEKLIEDLKPYTTDSIWVGTMNMIRKRVKNDSPRVEEEIGKIQAGQAPGKLKPIYLKYKNDPLIKWKGHFGEILKKTGIVMPAMIDDWQDKL